MTDQLIACISAVRTGVCSFCKFVSPNEAGETGANQAGLYISKKAVGLIFDTPGVKGQNREEIAVVEWFDGMRAPDCRLKYYGVGTRGEYRMTRLGRSFESGDLVILVKWDTLSYKGYVFNSEADKNRFLNEFGLTPKDVNALITPGGETITATDSEPEIPLDEEAIPESTQFTTHKHYFRPKAHILTLLGEELIRDPVMAIYELIKNSYDADAKEVNVSFNHITELDKANIVIIDSGLGLTDDVLKNVWLEPGTAYRKPFDENGRRTVVRSPIYGRVPMGEKGVGRFAVHKLGSIIRLKTRPARCIFDNDGRFIKKELLDYELDLEINWLAFTQSKYLSDVNIQWTRNTDRNSFYFRESCGTKIEISALKETWTRGMARSLKRQTISMVSPKNDLGKFQISLEFNNNWLEGFPDITEVLNQAPYKLTAILDKDYNFFFEYEFSLFNNDDIPKRKIAGNPEYDRNVRAEMRGPLSDFYKSKGIEEETALGMAAERLAAPLPFGSLLIEFYSFDLDSESLRDTSYSLDVVRKTLKDHHGVKIFKDDLRVYDYGETGKDWLGLDNRRVNNKTWMSNNQNIGMVYLDAESSGSLIEKTNREGFISNESFDFLVLAITFVLNQFRIERYTDRKKWRDYHEKVNERQSFYTGYENLTSLINDTEIPDPEKKQKLLDVAEGMEADYEKTKETLLLPAGIGLTASVALHEIEKLVPRMDETVNTVPLNVYKIRNQIVELGSYVNGILTILKQAGTSAVDVAKTIQQATRNYDLKFRMRDVTCRAEIDADVTTVQCDSRFLLTIFLNLLENSLYWLDTVNRTDKAILFKAVKKNGKVSIFVADNGPGFKNTPEQIVTPFFTRRDGGIGLGMYLVDTIMMKYGKLKIYTNNQEADVDSRFSGAIVELIFNKP
ncbi:ATP-binding protein [Longitalea arenae]|uniref:ATP-binding protein n=1 Tax=Longitalea arenae TaxID=2812558 RepID=UPI0019678A6A|nr:ATP-binding protein [Longitalea arenae]